MSDHFGGVEPKKKPDVSESNAERVVIPLFCATCHEDGEILFCGTGDTKDDAFNDFIGNGEFEDYCSYQEAIIGEPIKVYISNVINIKDSDWGEEADPKWQWCLEDKVETRTIPAV